jgi:C1A family cysteine protease
MIRKFKLGCKKDAKDTRDYLMKGFLPVVGIPKKIDYTRRMTPVRSQGDEGTCVGFAAVAGMKEYQEQLDWKKYMELSPRFLYSLCKKVDGYPNSEGTQIRIAMKMLKIYGTCREKFWPYIPHGGNKMLPGAGKDAARFKALTYARILGLDELKLSLFVKGPAVIGVTVFKGMMNTITGVVPMPKKTDTVLGGHALCAVGYDDRRRLVKFKNSWGEDWGDKGYGYLPYAYVNKYMMDAWSSVDIKDADPMTIGKVLRFANGA